MRTISKTNLSDRNRYLQILYKNGVSKKHIDIIMEDIDKSGIFDEPLVSFDEVDDLEYMAEIEMNPNSTEKDIEAARKFVEDQHNKRLEEKEKDIIDFSRPIVKLGTKTGKLVITEDMINTKRKKIMREISRIEGLEFTDEELDEEPLLLERFGRSPLHEAIAMRDLDTVKKYILKGKYLDSIDNSGNTPREFAFYEGWMEVVILFDEVERKVR
jgi:hypothetical protein